LDPDESELAHMTEEEFIAELEQQAEEIRRDPSLGIPWEEVKRRGLLE
jgi:hypothetical protein